MEQMTPEQAIEKLTGHTQYYVPNDDAEAFRMAIDALEKQVPKKPELIEVKKHNLIPYGYGFYVDHAMVCPVCKRKFGVAKVEHCSCGQAIDWSE